VMSCNASCASSTSVSRSFPERVRRSGCPTQSSSERTSWPGGGRYAQLLGRAGKAAVPGSGFKGVQPFQSV
jgi:hypothetical protein